MSTSTVLVSGGGSSSSSGGSVSVGGSSSAGGGSASAGAGAGGSVVAEGDYDLDDYKDVEIFKEENIDGDFIGEYDAYETDYDDKGGKVLPAVIYEDLKEVHSV